MTWFGENQDTRLDGNETVKGCLQVNSPEQAASIADWPSGLRQDVVASQGASVSGTEAGGGVTEKHGQGLAQASFNPLHKNVTSVPAKAAARLWLLRHT